jgi:hypothetical protein
MKLMRLDATEVTFYRSIGRQDRIDLLIIIVP